MKQIMIYLVLIFLQNAAAQGYGCEPHTLGYYEANFDFTLAREGRDVGALHECLIEDENVTVVYIAYNHVSRRLGEELIKEFLGSQATLDGSSDMDGWEVKGTLESGEYATLKSGTPNYMMLRDGDLDYFTAIYNYESYPLWFEHVMNLYE